MLSIHFISSDCSMTTSFLTYIFCEWKETEPIYGMKQPYCNFCLFYIYSIAYSFLSNIAIACVLFVLNGWNTDISFYLLF